MEETQVTEEETIGLQITSEFTEYYKLELSQVIDRINTIETVRVQLGTFFGTANLTALGVALSVQKAGIVLIAAAILGMFVVLDRRVRPLHLTYIYRGLQLQKRFSLHDNETFLQIVPGILASQAREISTLEDIQKRIAALNRGPKLGQLVWIWISIVLLELLTGIILWLAFDWPLF